MKAVIYFTEVPQQYEHKNMEHMIGEKLLATGLYKEYGLKLAFEPRRFPLKEIPGHLWTLPLIPTAMTKKLFRITLEMKAITLYNSHVNGKGDFL